MQRQVRNHAFFSAFLVLVTITSEAHADRQWLQGRLGSYLEPAYSRMIRQCQRETFKNGVSTIPSKIQEFKFVNPEDEVLAAWGGGFSPERVFSFIFTNDIWDLDVTRGKLEAERAYTISGLDLGVLPLEDPESPRSDRLYRVDTCDTAIGAAINAKLSVSDSIASAALSARASGMQQNELTLLMGSFISPLHVQLQSADPSVAIHPRVVIWHHYATYKNIIPTSDHSRLRYLASFRGAVVYESDYSASNAELTLKTSGNVSVPAISLSGEGSAYLKKEATTKIDRFGTFIKKDPNSKEPNPSFPPIHDLEPLPTPDEIISWISKNYEGKIDVLDKKSLPENAEFLHLLTLNGFPAHLCIAERFAIMENDSVRIKALLSSSPCRFLISFDTRDVSFAGGLREQDYILSYKLRLGESIGGKYIEIPVSRPIPRSGDLLVEPWGTIQGGEEIRSSKSQTRVLWTIPLGITDNQSRLDRTKRTFRADYVSSDCLLFDKDSLVLDASLEGRGTGVLKTTLYPRVPPEQIMSIPGHPCRLEVKLKLPLNGGREVEQTITIALEGPDLHPLSVVSNQIGSKPEQPGVPVNSGD